MKETDFSNGFSDFGKTEAVGSFSGMGVTETDFGGWDPEKQTTTGIPSKPPVEDSEITMPNVVTFQEFGQTVPLTPAEQFGFMPVVGWLVCIEGPDRGRDYRLHAGYNHIGRSPGNDVCVSGDATVARERHATVAFDPEGSLFFCAPGQSINLVRLNGKVLMMASPLNGGDVLTVGLTKLKFVPLCSESFSW